jgi:hypothetical protein
MPELIMYDTCRQTMSESTSGSEVHGSCMPGTSKTSWVMKVEANPGN